ncbi:MAG: ParB/RepB/Spo0J family partition protein [Gemmatimonadetes bacterium]|nr:ParB/RepB/Spo0J family partition protein [Gemmatimonadota bacterium]
MSHDRLGKGLGALLGDYLEPELQPGEVQKLRITSILPNPMQPRRSFVQAELEELAASIAENGLLQPVVVRAAAGADSYELIAGERRLRAVGILGWDEVPVIVRDASDRTLLVLALVENLQREALNPLEEAEGYASLGEQFDMKQADIAAAVGKDRSTVANLLRLLKLPVSVRRLVERGSLSAGHARALLAVDDPVRVAELGQQAAKEGWSVREVERRVNGTSRKKRKRKKTATSDPIVKAFESQLRDHFSTRVTIRGEGGRKGSIEIQYHGPEDFERIYELMTGQDSSRVGE